MTKIDIKKARKKAKVPYPPRRVMVDYLVGKGLECTDLAYWDDDTLKDGYDCALEEEVTRVAERIYQDKLAEDAAKPPKAKRAK